MTRVLFASVSDQAHADALRLAELAGLSLAKTMDALIADLAGRPHPLTPSVHEALKQLRRETRAS